VTIREQAVLQTEKCLPSIKEAKTTIENVGGGCNITIEPNSIIRTNRYHRSTFVTHVSTPFSAAFLKLVTPGAYCFWNENSSFRLEKTFKIIKSNH